MWLVRAEKDLYQHVYESKLSRGLSDAEQFRIFQDLQLGIFAIHDAGVVHNDIKPENVLLSPHGNWQITDFEGATYASDNHRHPLLPGHIRIHTKYYAPKAPDSGLASAANDLWSVGVTMHVVRYGEYLRKENRPVEPNPAWEYALSLLLSKSSETRITAGQLGVLLAELRRDLTAES